MVAEVNRAPAVQASGVAFTYQEGTRALEDVDFWAETGEFVAMLASNGSGKTTLVKVLVGLLNPQEGSVRIEGRRYTETLSERFVPTDRPRFAEPHGSALRCHR